MSAESGADDLPRPADAYGRGKLASERALAEVADQTGLELVILRPPLVYGPGVGGNFRALVRLAGSGMPLPFAALDNRRSFIHADNLTDLIAVSALHPAAPGQVLLASDGLTNHITDDDLRKGAKEFPDTQEWANHLVNLALKRGTRDNVTCVVVAFEPS